MHHHNKCNKVLTVVRTGTGCKVGGMEVVAFRPEKFGNDSPHAITAALKSTKVRNRGTF